MVQQMLLVALGGAIGSVLRFLTGLAMQRLLGHQFPWGTLLVNVLGGFAIGFLSQMILTRFAGDDTLRLFVLVGLLGGFTTFSSFTLEVLQLAGRGAVLASVAYVSMSVVLALVAALAGLWLARNLG